MIAPREAEPPLVPTVIAVLVAYDTGSTKRLLNYAAGLPDGTVLRLKAPPEVARQVRDRVRRRLRILRCSNVSAALDSADMCMVFGPCPLTPALVSLLEARGVPVEGLRGQYAHG